MMQKTTRAASEIATLRDQLAAVQREIVRADAKLAVFSVAEAVRAIVTERDALQARAVQAERERDEARQIVGDMLREQEG